MNIGGVIRKKRKQKGLSQKEFAKKLGVSWRTVQKWEHNESFPRPEMFKKIGNELDMIPIILLVDKDHYGKEIPKDILEAVKHPKMQEYIRAVRPFILDDD